MPFRILRNDITNMQVDAIVNTASPKPLVDFGVDSGIHRKAGRELLAARRAIGTIAIGQAAITPGFRLDAKYVIHTATPVWRGGSHGEEALLRSCYEQSMSLALRNGCRSLAFPLMSAGNHGFPKPLALQVAMNAISAFLLENEMDIYLVVFSRDAFALSEKLFQGVSSFIDENYVLEQQLLEYGVADKCAVREQQRSAVLEAQKQRRRAMLNTREDSDGLPPVEEAPAPGYTAPPPAPKQAPPPGGALPTAPAWPHTAVEHTMAAPSPAPLSLEELMREGEDMGFSEKLLELIDRTGKKDSEIYTRANVSRQHFSKIRNNPNYKPTKATALAFAIALELDMEGTRDLIGRAGFALTRSSKFDLIIMYFIRSGNYNLFDINAALFEFDQSLLGA